MNKLLFPLFCVSLGAVIPFFDNFENGQGEWTTGILTSGTPNDWALGYPNKTDMTGAHSGTNCWVTGLTDVYKNNADAYLQTPDFSFSNVSSAVVLSFYARWNFEASSVTSSCFDGFRLEYNYNGTWISLGNVGDVDSSNWYNTPSLTSGPDDVPAWGRDSLNFSTSFVAVGHLLPSFLNGKSVVKFRFVYNSDYSVGLNGVSIDDFRVGPQAPPKCVNYGYPANGGSVPSISQLNWTLSAGENPSAYLIYVGSSPSPSNYTLVTSLMNNFPVILPPGTFYWQVVPQIFGVPALNCPVRVASTLSKSLPYFTNWESGSDSWGPVGISSFVLGTPNKAVIQGAYSGVNAWVTGLTATYSDDERSFLMSPYFDFSTGNNGAIVSFRIWYDSESTYDGTNFQYSLDGVNWGVVGAEGGGSDWYTDAELDGLDTQPGWSGEGTNYVLVSHILTRSIFHNNNATFRFLFGADGSSSNYDGVAIDDFKIELYAPTPVACPTLSLANGTIVNNPPVLSWQTNDTLTGGYIIQYSLNPQLLVNGTDLGHTLTTTLPLLPSGTYYWRIIPYGEASPTQGCSVSTFIINDVVATIPYFQNFEQGQGGWSSRPLVSGDLNTWAFGTVNKTNIYGTGSGVNAWVTGGLNTTYPPDEVSYVQSPLFDLRNFVIDPILSLRIFYNLESGFDGVVVQVATEAFTWRTVGSISSGVNWYNTTVSKLVPFGAGTYAWSGQSLPWLNATNALTGTAGKITRLRILFESDSSVVRDGFAFDDVSITPIYPPTSIGTSASAGTSATNRVSSAPTISNPLTIPQAQSSETLVVSESAQIKAIFALFILLVSLFF